MQKLPAASGQRRAGNGQAARSPDYAGAYRSNGQRSPAHEQWCSLVGIFGVRASTSKLPSSASSFPPHTPLTSCCRSAAAADIWHQRLLGGQLDVL